MSHLKTIVMDSSTIERLERARFKFTLWKLIAFAVCVGGFIVMLLPVEGVLEEVGKSCFTIFGLVFWLLQLRQNKVFREADRDAGAVKALNNEMYVSYYYKSMACGFVVMIVFVLASFFWGRFVDISIQAFSVIVAYVGCLASGIRLLLYYKQS